MSMSLQPATDYIDKDGFRALVYSDTQMFSDIPVQVQGHVIVTMLAGAGLPLGTFNGLDGSQEGYAAAGDDAFFPRR